LDGQKVKKMNNFEAANDNESTPTARVAVESRQEQITESAVTQRIRRKLWNTDYMLRKARGERQQVDCGRYYVIDVYLNAHIWDHLNLEAYARELGVLRAHEVVAE